MVKKLWKDDLYYSLKGFFQKRNCLEILFLILNFAIGYIYICFLKQEWITPWYVGAIISIIVFLINSFYIVCINFVEIGKKIFDKKYNPLVFELKYLIVHFGFAVFFMVFSWSIKYSIWGKFNFISYDDPVNIPYIFFMFYGLILILAILLVIGRIGITGLVNLGKLIRGFYLTHKWICWFFLLILIFTGLFFLFFKKPLN